MQSSDLIGRPNGLWSNPERPKVIIEQNIFDRVIIDSTCFDQKGQWGLIGGPLGESLGILK